MAKYITPFKDTVKVCPECGKPKTKVTGDRLFSFDNKYFSVVSGLEQFDECECGIDLDDFTKKLLESII